MRTSWTSQAAIIPALCHLTVACWEREPDFKIYEVRHDLATSDIDVAVESSGMGDEWNMRMNLPTTINVSNETLMDGSFTFELFVCMYAHVNMYAYLTGADSLGIGIASFAPTLECPPDYGSECPMMDSCASSFDGTASLDLAEDEIVIRFEDVTVYCGLPDDYPCPRIYSVSLEGQYTVPLEYVGPGYFM